MVYLKVAKIIDLNRSHHKKNWQWMLTILTVVIISQYSQILNNAVPLK